MLRVVVAVVLLLRSGDGYSGEADTLRLSYLFPFSSNGEEEYNSGLFRQGAAVAMLAAEHWNSHNGSVVSDFATRDRSKCPAKIEYLMGDTQASPRETIALLTSQANVLPHGILGPGRSACASPLAITASIQTIPAVSYWATSPSLDQTSLYPYFGRTIPPDDAGATAIGEFFTSVGGWTRVGVVYVDDAYGSAYANAVSNACVERGMICETSSFESGNAESVYTALTALADYRIFLGIIFAVDLVPLIDAASSLNLVNSTVNWYFTDGVDNDSLTALSPRRARAIHGTGKIYATGAAAYSKGFHNLQAAYSKLSEHDYGPVLEEASEFAALEPGFFEKGNTFDVTNYVYDAVAVLALAACRSDDHPFSASNLDGDTYWASIVQSTFDGASGRVVLGAEGSRTPDSATYIFENFVLNQGSTALSPPVLAMGWNGHSWDELHPVVFSTGTDRPPSDQAVVDCDPGYAPVSGICAACPPGTYAPAGSHGCTPCDRFSFNEKWAQASCERCGAHAFIRNFDTGSESRFDCVCAEDTYSRTYPVGDCMSCSSLHAVCLGGTCQPYPKRKYWMSPEVDVKAKTYRCRYASFCVGGRLPVAAAGNYSDTHCEDAFGKQIQLSDRPEHWCSFGRDVTTPMCEDSAFGTSDPDRRYFTISTMSVRCPTRTWVQHFLFTVSCWLILLMLFFAINEVIRPRYAVLNLVLDVYQDVGVISTYRFFWPKSLESFFVAAYVALFDFDTYEPLCLLPDWGWTQAFYMMLAIPFLYGGLGACFTFSRVGWSRTDAAKEAWRRTLGSALAFLFGSLPVLVIKIQSTFACQSFEGMGKRQVEVNTSQCGDSEHKIRQTIAVLYGAGIVVAIPALVAIKVVRHARKNELCRPEVLQVYGFLYQGYQSESLFWGGWLVVKRVLLSTISATLWATPFAQGLAAVVVLAAVTAEQSDRKPYLNPACNVFERRGLIISIATVGYGLVFTGREDISESLGISKAARRREGVGYQVVFFLIQGVYLIHAITHAVADSRRVEARRRAAARLKQRATTPGGERSTDGGAEANVTELANTFKGPVFERFVKNPQLTDQDRENVEALDAAVAPFVCDASSTNNYSRNLEASFFRHLDVSFRALGNYLVDCPEEKRALIREALKIISREEDFFAKARFDRLHTVETIDRSSTLFFLLHCTPRQRRLFRDVVGRMVQLDQRLRDKYEKAKALRVAIAVQRMFRQRRAIRDWLSASGRNHVLAELDHKHADVFRPSAAFAGTARTLNRFLSTKHLGFSPHSAAESTPVADRDPSKKRHSGYRVVAAPDPSSISFSADQQKKTSS